MVYKKGDKGEKVKEIQIALGIKNADGIFGKQTEAEVKNFQANNGLVADGIVGKKTLAILMSSVLETDLTSKLIPSSDLIIEDYFLPKGEYIEGKYKNEYIVLHHTAGWDNPYGVVTDWAKDDRGRVATEFVMGGQRVTDGRDIYDGKIIHCFPAGCQAGHIGKSGSSYMNLHSVGIELCSFGGVKDGKVYTGTKANPSQVATLAEPFRGYTQYHKLSDRQIENLRKFLLFISNRDNIDLHVGLYQWIKKEGAKAFDFKQDAFEGKVKGVITHANIRKDKFDLFPQPELMDMIMTL